MSNPQRPGAIRLVIDLDLDREGEPISGELVEPPDSAGLFRGWLILTALIEQARQQAAKGSALDEP
jgi:hypothetical protein